MLNAYLANKKQNKKKHLANMFVYKRQDIILQYYNLRSIQDDDNPESSTVLLFSSDFNEPTSGIFHSSQNPSTFQELSKRNRRKEIVEEVHGPQVAEIQLMSFYNKIIKSFLIRQMIDKLSEKRFVFQK